MKIKISPLVYILAVYLFLIGRIVDFLSTMSVMFIHEGAHAIVSRRLGYKIGSIKIMPYGLMLCGFFESAPCRDECLIAIAGPLANLLTATVITALWWIAPVLYQFTYPIVSSSLALCLVNLLPVYPLDGGRIALALLSKKLGRARARRRLRPIGITLGVLLTALFIASCFFGMNVSYATMGGFMLLSTLLPDDTCAYERAYALISRRRKLKKGLPVRQVIISANAKVSALLGWINHSYWTEFTVVNEREEPLFSFSERELERISGEQLHEKVQILFKNGKNV